MKLPLRSEVKEELKSEFNEKVEKVDYFFE